MAEDIPKDLHGQKGDYKFEGESASQLLPILRFITVLSVMRMYISRIDVIFSSSEMEALSMMCWWFFATWSLC